MKTIRENNYVSVPSHYRKYNFSDSKYPMVSLGKLVEEVDKRNDINASVWSITNDQGFVLREKRFKEKITSKDPSKNKLVFTQHFAYSKVRIDVGSINYNNSEKTGCVSPQIGVVFKVKDENRIKPKYLFTQFHSERFKEQVKGLLHQETVRKKLTFNKFCEIKISLPSLEEQEKIIEELDKIEQVIKCAEESIKILNSRLSLSLLQLWNKED